MEDPCRTTIQDSQLASRKAEEAAIRRFQASAWLQSMVGPISLSSRPSEQEFLSCLRNGIVLCNTINKIQPGVISKVVENHIPLFPSDGQPLPAYQYFENVRNFLVAVEELKLPGFEASDLERDNMLEAGSTSKIVDCVLALKSYHEWKQCGGNGPWKYAAAARSPSVQHSAGRFHSHHGMSSSNVVSTILPRHLDMSAGDKQSFNGTANGKVHAYRDSNQMHQDLVDLLIKQFAEFLFNAKENIDQSRLLDSFHNENMDPNGLFNKIMSSFLHGQQLDKFPLMKAVLKEISMEDNIPSTSQSSETVGVASIIESYKGCKSCLEKGNCIHLYLLQSQERDIAQLKVLLLSARKEFEALQFQLQTDLLKLGNEVQDLSIAAGRYHQVAKENRTLYNTLQDLKGNIRVYCRIRPIRAGNPVRSTIDFFGEDGSLIIVDPLKPQSKDSHKIFQFNRVFGPDATQEEVYMDTQPLIRSVMDGFNVCIFAYGQTGSGKTYTMCGPCNGSSNNLGINYLALSDLFQISYNRKDSIKYEVQVQMVEIYNEQVRDLLAVDASTTKLEIRNCSSSNGSTVTDANMHRVQSTADVMNLMNLGEKNRVVSATAINNRSSRSHSVLTVHVQGTDTSGCILRSCLHLVDLAGSERVDKSEVTGDRLKEAQHINKSLSSLGDVIAALAQKNSHIPYRNSKLTQLLQDSLGGHAKTLMFAHVSPEADSYGETISTLKFAERVATVELGAARVNKESADVRELKEQIVSLKQALAKKEEESSQKPKELKSPLGNSRFKVEVTPPSRRLSIEVPNVVKIEQANSSKDKDPRSPKLMTAKTPPRPRRLSIDGPNLVNNSSSDKREKRSQLVRPKFINENNPIHPKKLGLEAPTKYGKNDHQQRMKQVSENFNMSLAEEQSVPCNSQEVWVDGAEFAKQASEANFLSEHCINSLSYQNQMKVENRMRSLQLPKTPRKDGLVEKHSEALPNTKSQIPSVYSSTATRKGSHIRKSLLTIGKFITGPEKRNHNQISPVYSSKGNVNNDSKSPTSAANGSNFRRQSLTGVQTSGLDSSRRVSIGGRSIDPYSNETRNSKTPPPVAKTTKR